MKNQKRRIEIYVNGSQKSIKIQKKTDELYLVNGKTIYIDMNGNWSGRINLNADELLAFQKEIEPIKASKSKIISDYSIPRNRVFVMQVVKTKEPVNNYEKYITAAIAQYNRKVIYNKKLTEFKREVIEKINFLNGIYEPEKPVKPIWNVDKYNDRELMGIDFLQINLIHGFLKF